MRKVIAAFNMTIDGFCDHTVSVADEALHQHYTDLLNDADHILYGRTTYQLMQYWQTLIVRPSEEKSMNDFAAAIDRIPKVVFSNTLKITSWDSAVLSDRPLVEKVNELKQQNGGDILVGSRSLIVALLNLNLIDELQLCIHPIIVGKGLSLFGGVKDMAIFSLLKTKSFKSGATVNFYQKA